MRNPPPSQAPSPSRAALTVREVTAHVRQLLERSELLQDLDVRGEISNFTRHTSGHLYFTLKDEYAALGCVCFRSAAARLTMEPANGQSVVAGGRIGVYEKGGRYQLIVEWMQPDGWGALAAALEKLKAKLEAEGLFDASRKRPLPRFPRTVAVLTSPTGAAVRDMLTILSRRYPPARVLLYPTVVQGEEAPASIVASLRAANERADVELILLGRGGGSMEDLWAFNDEGVARAIFASRVPVVSAVGHETDFTIADFVADLRAPTPSAAAELAVPDAGELRARLGALEQHLRLGLRRRAEVARGRLDALLRRPGLARPRQMLEERQLRVDEAAEAATAALRLRLERARAKLAHLAAQLTALGPPEVLRRGYAICQLDDGAVVRSVAQVSVGAALQVSVNDGLIRGQATATEPRP